jgi:predicted DNA-binding protein
MTGMTTVRLPLDIDMRLAMLTKMWQKTKSQVIKEILESFFRTQENEESSYALGKDFFGRYGSGNGNLSKDYKKLIKGKLYDKHHPH